MGKVRPARIYRNKKTGKKYVKMGKKKLLLKNNVNKNKISIKINNIVNSSRKNKNKKKVKSSIYRKLTDPLHIFLPNYTQLFTPQYRELDRVFQSIKKPEVTTKIEIPTKEEIANPPKTLVDDILQGNIPKLEPDLPHTPARRTLTYDEVEKKYGPSSIPDPDIDRDITVDPMTSGFSYRNPLGSPPRPPALTPKEIEELKKHAYDLRPRGEDGKVRPAGKGVFHEGYPPAVRRYLTGPQGNAVIKSLVICRKPILKVIDGILNIISLGKWKDQKRKYGYSDLMHLFCVINGNVRLERNHVIEMYPGKNDGETMQVNLKGKELTIAELLINTEKKYGKILQKYVAENNNCQVFQKQLLSANGLLTSELESFIMQPVEKIISGLPKASKLVINGVTNIAGILDKFFRGSGAANEIKEMSERKGKFNSPLYDTELMDLLLPLKEFSGILMRNELPEFLKLMQKRKLPKFSFIINTDKTTQEGKHWQAIRVDLRDDKEIDFYDSFGRPAPKSVMEDIKAWVKTLNLPYYLKYKTNRVIHQSSRSNRCGLHCANFLTQMAKGKSFSEATDYDSVKEAEGDRMKDEKKFRKKFGYI